MQAKQTILIVDDVSENVDVLVQLLNSHDLVTSLDGQTAIEIATTENIDLILLDIMMPDMNGFEVCEQLKANHRTSHIPIIFLSARDKHEDIQKGFNLGAVDYITKPFNPNELLSRVQTHLKLRAYEKDLEKKVQEEIQKNHLKQQLIHQQSKQAALGELLMHIAHQWKQPLAALSSINLLARARVQEDMVYSKEEALSKISKVEELIEFMSNTVETFRNFYQPSNKSQEFSLTDSVHKVLSIVNATLSYHNIHISILSHEIEPTYANENEFTQVLLSLLNNAKEILILRKIKKPTIKIEIFNNIIMISDNAGGVEKGFEEKLFKEFHSTTGGNGVGLYIAKEIVEKNGGIISSSNDDRGAVFKVEFLTWSN